SSASRSIASSSARSSATLGIVRSWQAIATSTRSPSPREARGAASVRVRSAGASEFRLGVIDTEDNVAGDAGIGSHPRGLLRLSERGIRLGRDRAELLGAIDERVHEFIPFRLRIGLILRPAQGVLDRLGLLGELDQVLGALLDGLLGLLEVGQVARSFLDV